MAAAISEILISPWLAYLMSAAARASAAAMIERTKVSLNARALSMPHLRTALGVVQGELACRLRSGTHEGVRRSRVSDILNSRDISVYGTTGRAVPTRDFTN